MSEQRHASVWEYMSVAHRSRRAGHDALTWLRRPNAMCSPWMLRREMRSPWWASRPAWARILWIGGMATSTAGVAGLAAGLFIMIASVASGSTGSLRPFWLWWWGCIAAMWTWPLGVFVFIALRAPDRALVPLRRARAAGLRPWERGPAAAADELLYRRAFWAATVRRWHSGSLERRHLSVDPRPFLLQLGGLVLTLAVCWTVRGVGSGILVPILLVLSFLAMAIATRRQRSGLRGRIRAAIEVRGCPDCGYSLEGAPGRPADPDALAAWPGPRRCPECASPWPLIPPAPPPLVDASGDEVGTWPERAARAAGAAAGVVLTPRSGPGR